MNKTINKTIVMINFNSMIIILWFKIAKDKNFGLVILYTLFAFKKSKKAFNFIKTCTFNQAFKFIANLAFNIKCIT